MNILNAVKGISGEFEINRLIGGIGSAVYVVCGNAFVAWDMFEGHPFDITAYCLAFPTGLAAAVGATAGAVALKDRNVATARIIQDTGAVPTKAPAGPQVPPQRDVPPAPGAELDLGSFPTAPPG